jgi:hypothetical protein
MARPQSRKDRPRNQRRFSVLADWGQNHSALGDYFEMIEGPFTLSEAESLCRECERLGAIGASVHSRNAARKLYESNQRGARLRRALLNAEANQSPTSHTS